MVYYKKDIPVKLLDTVQQLRGHVRWVVYRIRNLINEVIAATCEFDAALLIGLHILTNAISQILNDDISNMCLPDKHSRCRGHLRRYS